MYGSQFDSNAAFSGGGYMAPPTTQSADLSSSSSSSKGNREAQGLVPLTVKQLNEALLANADSNNFMVDGVDVNNVTIFGMVFNKAERVTDVGFVIDDGTGRINVHKWVNETWESREMEKVMDGMYVRVHGNLKGFQGKKQLVAFTVRPVTDFNELIYHFLECMYVHMYNTKMRTTSVSADPQMIPSVNGTPFGGYQSAQQTQFSELTGDERMVMEFLQQPANLFHRTGVHVTQLVQELNIPLERIRGSLEALETEGMVYTTIDSDHYKSTANA